MKTEITPLNIEVNKYIFNLFDKFKEENKELTIENLKEQFNHDLEHNKLSLNKNQINNAILSDLGKIQEKALEYNVDEINTYNSLYDNLKIVVEELYTTNISDMLDFLETEYETSIYNMKETVNIADKGFEELFKETIKDFYDKYKDKITNTEEIDYTLSTILSDKIKENGIEWMVVEVINNNYAIQPTNDTIADFMKDIPNKIVEYTVPSVYNLIGDKDVELNKEVMQEIIEYINETSAFNISRNLIKEQSLDNIIQDAQNKVNTPSKIKDNKELER